MSTDAASEVAEHPADETPAQSLEDKVAILERTLKLVRRSRDQLVYQVSVVTKERDQARAALREFEEADTIPFPKAADHATPEGKRFAEESAAWAGLEAEDAKTLPQHVSGKVGNA